VDRDSALVDCITSRKSEGLCGDDWPTGHNGVSYADRVVVDAVLPFLGGWRRNELEVIAEFGRQYFCLVHFVGEPHFLKSNDVCIKF